MALEEKIQELDKLVRTSLEKSAETAEKAIEEYEELRLYDNAFEMTETAIEEYKLLRWYNQNFQIAEETEKTLKIGLYVGQQKCLEAHKIAYGLEQNGYEVVMINSEVPNDLDISVNGIMFSCGEADRMIERLLIPKVKKDTG